MRRPEANVEAGVMLKSGNVLKTDRWTSGEAVVERHGEAFMSRGRQQISR
jgi:hypothetical protein